MRKRIISENFENRIQELSGIIQENVHKIMKFGFDSSIADYLAGMDNKRGLFLADLLTRQYLKDSNISELHGLNIKQILESINQEELFNYIKSRENEILEILSFIKQGGGQINLKSFNNFNDLYFAASEQQSPSDNEEEGGFNPEIEEYLRGLDYDFGVDIGVVALKGFFKHEHPEFNINSIGLGEMIQSINQEEFLRFLKENENEIDVIVEWINSAIRQEDEGPLTPDFIKRKNFQNLGDALFVANEWHTNIQASGKLKNKLAGTVVERYPDGYYWMDLNTNNSKDEGQAMGHCGTDGRATTLFSLRDEKGEPHVTIAYNEKSKNVGQVKGKNNKRPVDKYMKYVNDFLGKLVKNNKLESFTWSYPVFGPDLNKEEIDGALSNLSAKAKFNIAKKGAIRRVGRSNLGIRY